LLLLNERPGQKTAHQVMRDILLARLRESWNNAEIKADRLK